jgi:hypothetical protein
LADVLDDPGRLGAAVGPDVLDEVRAHLEATAAEVGTTGGWTESEPLRLAKGSVTWLLRCPRRAVAPDGARDERGVSDDLVLGIVVDAAAKLAALGARRPVTAAGALAYAQAAGDATAADHVAGLDGPAVDALMAEAALRVARVTGAWPPVEPGWWPRVEEPARVRLAEGAVTVTGRLDVLLGGPPTGRPGVVVEVKGGRWYDGMRADAHLYALLVGLRDGVAPAAVVTVVADGTTQVEPIGAGLVRHAGERLEQALRTAAGLAAGEVPEARPGSHCTHCPVRADCAAGTRWIADPSPGPSASTVVPPDIAPPATAEPRSAPDIAPPAPAGPGPASSAAPAVTP